MMVGVFKKGFLLSLSFFLFSQSLLWAQDSMILKNGAEMQIKVMEVSSDMIKYKKQDNPDGPVYTYSIKDVLLIKYANGTKDVFGKLAPSITPGAPESSATRIETINHLMYKRGFCSSQFVTAQGTRLSGAETRSILAMTPTALDSYQRGKVLRVGGYVTSAAAIGMIGGGLGIALLGGDGFGGGENHGDGENGDSWQGDQNGDENGSNRDHGGDHGNISEVGFIVAGAGVLTGLVGVWLDHRATVNFRRAADQYNTSRPVSLHFGPSRRGLGVGMALKF